MIFAEAKRSQKQENSSNIYLDIYINCSLFFLFEYQCGEVLHTHSEMLEDNNFLSLKEYNAEYSNGENPLKIDSPLTTQNVPDICYFPYPKTKTIILGQ